MLKVTIRTLKILAAIVWYTGAVVLLLKGGGLLLQAVQLQPGPGWPVFAVAAAVLAGRVVGRLQFQRFCRHNVRRIAGLSEPKIWQLYRTRFYFFLGLMLLAGAAMSQVAEGRYILLIAVGWLDLTLALALLVGSTAFWQSQNSV